MRMRRKLSSALSIAVGAILILLSAQTAAQAETKGTTSVGEAWVQQDTSYGYCRAEVIADPNKPDAYGTFVNHHAGWSCTGWLERSIDNGGYWYTVSGYHTVDTSSADQYAATGDYWDSRGYLARVCFRLNFAGAATHCSPGIGGFIVIG